MRRFPGRGKSGRAATGSCLGELPGGGRLRCTDRDGGVHMADGFSTDAAPADRPLTDEEFGLLQHYIDAIMERLAAERFSVVIETDFSGLMEFMESVSYPFRNPTFDPDCSDLSRDAFWLRVIDENGVTVACHAERVFEIDSYDTLVA